MPSTAGETPILIDHNGRLRLRGEILGIVHGPDSGRGDSQIDRALTLSASLLSLRVEPSQRDRLRRGLRGLQ